MPYRRNNYSFVVDSSFNPFSFQELVQPFILYKDAFEKTEEAYNDLSQKADSFKYLSDNLPEDSRARQIYEGYANELKTQAEDLAQHGLSMRNRRALTNLKRRYQGEIGRLDKADTALQEERKLRREMNVKDSSLLYANDSLSVDDFLDNNTPNLYSVSGDELYRRGAQAGQSASSRIYQNTEVSDLTKYFQEITQKVGYTPELLTEFRNRLEAIPELNEAVNSILEEKGVNENLTGTNWERARRSVIDGIMDGAIYKESRSAQQNPGVLTAAQADASARGWRGLELESERLQMAKDQQNQNEWMYTHSDEEHPSPANRTGFSDAYKAEVREGTIKGYDNNSSGSSNSGSGSNNSTKDTRKPKGNFTIDKEGTVAPVSTGSRGNASYGKRIASYDDAVAMNPALTLEVPREYSDLYDFYQTSDGKITAIGHTPQQGSGSEVPQGDGDNQL